MVVLGSGDSLLPEAQPESPKLHHVVGRGGSTLPETNIAPRNRPSQKEIHLPSIFRGYVSFREGITF